MICSLLEALRLHFLIERRDMRKLFGAALLAGLLSVSTAVHAKTTLRFSNWLPPTHPITVYMIKPWADSVAKASNGNVVVDILAKPLGKPPSHYDLARDGIADVTLGVHGYTPGRFVATQIAEIPFLGESAEAISVAYWRTHEKYLAGVSEHEGTKLLGVFTHGPGHIYTIAKPISQLSDLEGMKIRVGGGVVNDVGKALGVVTLLKPASESYEILSRGVADGIFFPKESIASFKINKVLRYATLIPGGMYNTSFFLVMNQRKWDRLSSADQQAIDSVSGEAFAKLAGKGWDRADEEGVAGMKEGGMSINNASPKLMGELKSTLAGIESTVLQRLADKGVDGKAALAMLRAEAAAYRP
jgi:TRAP-type C4-dicarboxylate transport system substrate-binding protein